MLSRDSDLGGHMPIRTTVKPFLREEKVSSRGNNNVKMITVFIFVAPEILV